MPETTDQAVTPAAPLTFADAYAADASPVSDSTPTSESTTTPAAAQPGAEQGSPQSTDDRSPYIPRTRFDEVNTRLKAAEAWKQQYGWAEQIDQKTLQEAVDFYGRYTGDPVEYIQRLIADVQAHPEHGAKLRSIAARTLGQRQQQAPAAPIDLNPIAVELADGRVIQVHTSEQIEAMKGQWSSQLEQKLQPAMTAAEKLQKAEAVQQADQFATNLVSELKKQPGFEAHQAAIGADVKRQIAQLAPNDPRSDSQDWLETATLRAYNRIVVPTLQASAQSSQLDDLQRKAAASTGINPGSAAPTSPRRPTSFSDPSLKW